MTKAVYITSVESNSGKSLVVMGLLNVILAHTRRTAFFKPIIKKDSAGERDVENETMIRYFGLSQTYQDTYCFTREEIAKMMMMMGNAGSRLIEGIIGKFRQLGENYDFIVMEGSDFLGKGAVFELNANIFIPRELGIPVILVVVGEGHEAGELGNHILEAYRSFTQGDVEVLAVIVNKVRAADVKDLEDSLRGRLPGEILTVMIPELKELKNPTFREINEHLGAKVLSGHYLLDSPVDRNVVGAMHLHHFLDAIGENTLIITSGDRSDIIIGASHVNLSKNFPAITGILLTGGLEPEESVMKLIEGQQNGLPLSSVEASVYDTANLIGEVRSQIYPGNARKIELALQTFDRHIDMSILGPKILTFRRESMTPHMFLFDIMARAKRQKRHIVLAEGNDDRILAAADRLIGRDIVDLTILGNRGEIDTARKRLRLQLDMGKIRIIDPLKSESFEDYAQTLYELRRMKSVTPAMARDMMEDVAYFGTMMVYKGHADGMVSGASHTTQQTIRPALQFVKTKPGVSIVSSVFFMCLPNRVSVFGDCAVNPDPTAEELADIAISSAESAMLFGIEVRIAMLSYSSGTSGEGKEVEKVRRATEIVRRRRPDLKVEGPIQYDAAVDPAVGRQKMPGSEVAGQASVLIFPDLNTGNNTYKAVQRETGALAIGPILQGLIKPVNDLSRGCSIDDIVNTVIMTAIQSQEKDGVTLLSTDQ